MGFRQRFAPDCRSLTPPASGLTPVDSWRPERAAHHSGSKSSYDTTAGAPVTSVTSPFVGMHNAHGCVCSPSPGFIPTYNDVPTHGTPGKRDGRLRSINALRPSSTNSSTGVRFRPRPKHGWQSSNSWKAGTTPDAATALWATSAPTTSNVVAAMATTRPAETAGQHDTTTGPGAIQIDELEVHNGPPRLPYPSVLGKVSRPPRSLTSALVTKAKPVHGNGANSTRSEAILPRPRPVQSFAVCIR